MSLEPFVLKNIFSDEQIEYIKDAIFRQSSGREIVNLEMPYSSDISDKEANKIYSALGRLDVQQIQFKPSIIKTIEKKLNDLNKNKKFYIGSKDIIVSKYSGEYGVPALAEHKDGGISSVIVDYQLESNISWNISANGKEYEVSDNEALVFDPVLMSHSRPKKEFTYDQYVTMIYFRGNMEEKD
jgi:hypothetical protein